MKKPLTAQQSAALGFIKDFVRLNGYPPSMRQIADALDLASASTAHGHVHALVRKGHLVIDGGPRTLRVVKSA